MSGFNDIYNTQTIRIMKGLYNHEFDDPIELRAALEKCELFSFGQELWQATLTRYPCELYIRIIDSCEKLNDSGNDLSLAGEALPASKRSLWKNYTAEHKPESSEKIVEFVTAFFRETCRSNPICRPCRCKKELTDFFEQISGDRHDSVKKTINNWISGHSHPNTRDGYIQLCYALGLRVVGSEAVKTLDANRFLSLSCGQNPLYLRSAQESIHYFCLKRPFGKDLPMDEKYDNVGNYRYAMDLADHLNNLPVAADVSGNYTIQARLMIDGITDEQELLGFVSGHSENHSERYYSAQELLKKFLKEYEQLLHDMETDEKNKEKRPMTKGTAIEIVDIFSKVSTDRSSIRKLEKMAAEGFALSDALYRSDIVQEMANGQQTVSRSILLLTALSLNYGTAFDVRTGRMRATRSFDDIPSFQAFCRTISAVLDSCTMAMFYPRRKIDFLILHSYMSMTRDMNKTGFSDSLSYYLIESLKLISNCAD